MTYSQNWYKERKNNYNFWPIEDSMLGKPNYFLDKYDLFRFPDSLQTPIGWIGYRLDSSFASFAKINVEVRPEKLRAAPGKSIELNCFFNIPAHYADFIRSQTTLDDSTLIGVFTKYGWMKDIPVNISLKNAVDAPQQRVTILPDLPKGKYYLRFSIAEGKTNATHNSDKIELVIE
jgi:hypothetical protein